MRVIQYANNGRLHAIREHELKQGYASGFHSIMDYLYGVLPSSEIVDPFRRVADMYPRLATRELVANALIHQDLSVLGAGPTIEIFSDRVEITNPGIPLVATDRFLDSPPRSRNENLAAFMRRVGICEERGSGVDKVVSEIEFAQLPAPEFRVHGDNTVATLFGPRALEKMDREDRSRAVYLHVCLHHVMRQPSSNTTIRERFGLTAATKATRLLNEAVDDGLIKVRDEAGGYRFRQYIPYWA